MMDELPNDDDGNALRQLALDGSDISRSMLIDCAVSVPNKDKGMAFAATVAKIGFKTDVHFSHGSKRWTCYCTCTMIPSYNAMIDTQAILKEAGRPFDAKPDGWGSFGNAPEA